jgi:hypothetical protein
MLHGQLLPALALNPLATLAGVTFVIGGILAPLWTVLGGGVPALPRPLPVWARLTLILALAANWAWVVWRG